MLGVAARYPPPAFSGGDGIRCTGGTAALRGDDSLSAAWSLLARSPSDVASPIPLTRWDSDAVYGPPPASGGGATRRPSAAGNAAKEQGGLATYARLAGSVPSLPHFDASAFRCPWRRPRRSTPRSVF